MRPNIVQSFGGKTRLHAHRSRARAFTMVEILVVVGIMMVLMGLLIGVLVRSRAAARNVQCLTNLHNLVIAFQMYEQDNAHRLPDPGQTQVAWEEALHKYTSAGAFECPSDEELAPATGSSYDWRDTGDDATTLASHSLSDAHRPGVILVFDALPAWHAKKRMNVARVDGSAGSMDQVDCVNDLNLPIVLPPVP